ncbi:MAG: ABC transporter ATP-binding protein [Eubacteriaceae bacterium]|nr:ABC transporter ATP-binding protein [Eubacteriaceae bacterium]
MDQETILSVENFNLFFNLRGERLHAIRNVSLSINRGECLAIVGESGSGKSVFCRSLLGLNDKNSYIGSGTITYGQRDLAKITAEEEWQKIRGKEIAIVMQDPMTSLNPLIPVGKQVAEAVSIHQGLKGKPAKQRAIQALVDVGIDNAAKRYSQYPHEFSGGMRQRVVISIAIACQPRILICDEPTTALDVTIQAQILNLVKDLQKKHGLTTIYVTHDLGVVATVADRVAVMYAGEFVEIGTAEEIFFESRHPYTWALLSSMPQLGTKGEDLFTIPGAPPNLFMPIAGDAFAPRNPFALKIDFVEAPPFFQVSDTHFVKSWLLDEMAPDIQPPEAAMRKRGLR